MRRREFVIASASLAGVALPAIARAVANPCAPPSLTIDGGAAVTTACAAKTYTTNFAGLENPLSEGGVWSNVGLDWTNVQKVNGLACGTLDGTGGYNDSYAHLSGFPADHTASAVVRVASGLTDTHEVELLMRWADSARSARGYECNMNYQGGCQIVRWNGTIGDFTVLGGANAPGVSTGDVFKASVVGNVITVWLNNTQIVQVTDGTFTSGNPGIGFYRRTSGANTDYGFTSFTATSP